MSEQPPIQRSAAAQLAERVAEAEKLPDGAKRRRTSAVRAVLDVDGDNDDASLSTFSPFSASSSSLLPLHPDHLPTHLLVQRAPRGGAISAPHAPLFLNAVSARVSACGNYSLHRTTASSLQLKPPPAVPFSGLPS
jgi:hypothetical protein